MSEKLPCLTTLIPDQDRLTLLRAGDDHRDWRSLDDQRFCLRCTRVFAGREVEIVGGAGGGPVLRCPTEGCDSTTLHWLFCGRGRGERRRPRRRQIPCLREF